MAIKSFGSITQPCQHYCHMVPPYHVILNHHAAYHGVVHCAISSHPTLQVQSVNEDLGGPQRK